MKRFPLFILRNAPVAIIGALLGRAGLLPFHNVEWWLWMLCFVVVLMLRDAAEGSK